MNSYLAADVLEKFSSVPPENYKKDIYIENQS